MFRVLSIDPGNDTGWCHWADGRVVSAGLGAPPSLSASPDVVLVEIPQVYTGGPKVDQNDLVKLSLTAGRQVERFRFLESLRLGKPVCLGVYPRKWKGTLDKHIMIKRFQVLVGPTNKTFVEECMDRDRVPTGKRHNVWDAVGLGHWAITQAMVGAKLGKGPVQTIRELTDYVFLDL
jgi:hypothetical protein